MKEYDVFLPLFYNEGEPVEALKFRTLHRQLLEEFGAYTLFPVANEGVWRMGSVEYRDKIVIYRVVASQTRKARLFMMQLKQELLRAFRQEEIFIIERDVRLL